VADNLSPERREVYYSGVVQGVGFRYTTARIAGRFPVVGFVRNLPDGRVHVVVEGPPHEADAFLSAVRSRMERYIEDVQETAEPATGQFKTFEIRF